MENIKISSKGTVIILNDKKYDLSKCGNGFETCLNNLKLKDDDCKMNSQFMSALKSVYDEVGKKFALQQKALMGALFNANLNETARTLPNYKNTSTVSSKTSEDLPKDVNEISPKPLIEKDFKNIFVEIESLGEYSDKTWKSMIEALDKIRVCFEKNNSIRKKYSKTYAAFSPSFNQIKASNQEKEKEFKNQKDLCTNLSLSKLVKGKIGTFRVVWTDKCAKNLKNLISRFLKKQSDKKNENLKQKINWESILDVFKEITGSNSIVELVGDFTKACMWLKSTNIENKQKWLNAFEYLKSGCVSFSKVPTELNLTDLKKIIESKD